MATRRNAVTLSDTIRETSEDVQKAEIEHPQSVLSDKPQFAPATDTSVLVTDTANSYDDAAHNRVSELEAKLAAYEKAKPQEDPNAKRIAELEAKLAALESQPKPVTPYVPKPTSQMTPEELRIRDLEDRLARRTASDLDREPEVFDSVKSNDSILIHVLEDGTTVQGRVWYKGQEIEFAPGSQAYEDTKDRNGVSWLSIVDDEFLQAETWGKVRLRRGPWPGHKYVDDASILEERKRNRAAPILSKNGLR